MQQQPALFPTSKRELFLGRTWQLFLVGCASSECASALFDIALPLWIVLQLARGESWAALAVGTSLSVSPLAGLISSPFAGIVVDRWKKGLLILFMEASRAVLLGAFCLLLTLWWLRSGRLPPLQIALPVVYGVVFVDAVSSNLSDMVRTALVAQLAGESVRGQALAYRQIVEEVVSIPGSLLAALLFSILTFPWLLAFCTLLFLVSTLSVFPLRHVEALGMLMAKEKPSFFRELSAGVRFIGQTRGLVIFLLAAVFYSLGTIPVGLLNAPFVTQNLHAPASVYGLLETATNIGVVIGLIGMGALMIYMRMKLLLIITFFLQTLVLWIYARQTQAFAAVALYGLYGVIRGGSTALFLPLLLQRIPAHLVARVYAAMGVFISLAALVGGVLASYLASTLHTFHASFLGISWGAIDTVYIGGGVLILLSALFLLRYTPEAP